MSDTILSGDFTIFYKSENGQKRLTWTGSATGTRTCNEVYSALQRLFEGSGQMDDKIPIQAVTPDIYRIINQWFIDDSTIERLTGGSIFTQGWIDGTTEHVLTIGSDFATSFSDHDIGRTIVATTSGDTGTLLDFNSTRGLLWIRPTDPDVAGDEFDHPTEAYSIQDDSAIAVWQVDADGGPGFSDQTTNFNDATPANLTLFPASEATTDYCAFGFSQEFSKLIFDAAGGTAGVGGVVDWEYWNGSAWTALTGVTDGTSDFTVGTTDGQEVIWTAPTDWATLSLNSGPLLFYVRAVITTIYSTNPIYDQGFVSGQGAGNFQIHARHGGGSSAGESAWAGIQSIGAVQENTEAYVFQESSDVASGSFSEEKVLATKGTDVWYPQEGHLNILVKTKEADNIFGPNPDLSTEGIATFFMRQYSKSYSHFIATSLKTAGGNTVVPFATADDLDNTTGHRELSTDADSGTWNSSDVDTVMQEQGNTNNKAIITAISGTTPNFGIKYYLIYTQEDFADDDVLEDEGTTKTLTVFGSPADTGPASLDMLPAFGDTTEDINNGNGARPYSVRIDPSTNALADVYERLKYLNRRGSQELLQGQVGEEYLGNDLQIEYTTMMGTFISGTKVYDQTSNAEGILVADHNDGSTGDVILKATRGTFTTTNIISDSPSPSASLSVTLQVDDSPFGVTDLTTAANSPGGADVDPYPATEAIGDYFAFGAIEPFASASFDISTAGTVGVGLWEYWNGSAWSDLESTTGFGDESNDFTGGTGLLSMSFAPPVDWLPTTVVDGALSWGPFYYVRHRVTTVFTINPVLHQVLLADNATASIGTTRTIVPISVAPFGTLAGGKFFGAPGVTLTTSNLASGEEQSYQLIDDDGSTQVPPNAVSITLDNLISGDSVAVFRRTGTVINKTQFALAAGNTIGDSTVLVDATIDADNPTNAESKIRVISAGGQEHRYRYTSYASTTFTLSAESTGTDGGTGTTTTIVDGGATFQTDLVEPGDMVRNTSDGLYSVIVSVDSETALTVTSNGTTWASKIYSVNTLVETYATALNAYVPLIERIADATSESNQLVFSTNITLRAVVRRSNTASEILPFEQDTTMTGNLTITAIRNSDDIIT